VAGSKADNRAGLEAGRAGGNTEKTKTSTTTERTGGGTKGNAPICSLKTPILTPLHLPPSTRRGRKQKTAKRQQQQKRATRAKTEKKAVFWVGGGARISLPCTRTRCRDRLNGSPSVPCPLQMDWTAWFGPQGVISSGEAALISGSGPVHPAHN
jgi:hypothetical protein